MKELISDISAIALGIIFILTAVWLVVEFPIAIIITAIEIFIFNVFKMFRNKKRTSTTHKVKNRCSNKNI